MNDILYGLLPGHLLLALVMLLMLMEMARTAPGTARVVAGVFVLAALGVTLQQLGAGYSAQVLPGELHIDRFALWAQAVLLGCGLALVLGFQGLGGHKFWMLVAAMLLGGVLVVGSAGFATLFIGIEMLSLPVFALMVQGQGRSAAPEGAFKYLLMSSVGTALLLFGISLSYGATASLSIAAFVQALGEGQAPVQAAALLMLGGLFLKAAVFPLHAWAPDAYAAARLEVTAVMASVVKVAVVLGLVRIVLDAPLDGATTALVAPLAVVSIVFGNLAALGQERFKRLLAYSSVAHAGYMIFALLDGTGQRPGDLLWYTAFYALASLLACACYAVLSPACDDESGEGGDRLDRLDGQFQRHPMASLGLALALLSLAGLPPFPGFFAKFFIFSSAIASGHLLAAVLAFLASFLGLAVYLGMVLRLFRTSAGATPAEGRSSPAGEAGA